MSFLFFRHFLRNNYQCENQDTPLNFPETVFKKFHSSYYLDKRTLRPNKCVSPSFTNLTCFIKSAEFLFLHFLYRIEHFLHQHQHSSFPLYSLVHFPIIFKIQVTKIFSLPLYPTVVLHSCPLCPFPFPKFSLVPQNTFSFS